MQTPRARDGAPGPAEVAKLTSRFLDLQGLRQVVAGVALLLILFWTLVFPVSSAGMRAAGTGRMLWGLGAAVLIAGALVYSVRRTTRWYRERYGEIQHTDGQRRRMLVLGISGIVAFLIPFQVEVSAMNAGRSTPFNLMVAGLTVWVAVYWIYLGRSFVHYGTLAAVGLVLTLASAAGLPPAEFTSHLRESLAYIAVASIVGGLLDHRILAAALPQPAEPIGNQPGGS